MPLPSMYTEHAAWYPLLSPPEDYVEEAAFYTRLIEQASARPPRTLLELGSGAGSMAVQYVQHFDATLSDLSPEMLALSREIHPTLEHIVGDMRTLRVGREFDAVFVHDAVCYLTSEDDLRQCMATAWAHLRPGGVAVFAPDHTQENLEPGTDHGGHDSPDGARGLRYLEWTHAAEPGATWHAVDYVLVFNEAGKPLRVEHDRHIHGLFSRDTWLRLLHEAGFEKIEARPLEHSEVPPGSTEVFVAVRPD